jgi:protocatechuate 3,4-dioxygenase, beta subunit
MSPSQSLGTAFGIASQGIHVHKKTINRRRLLFAMGGLAAIRSPMARAAEKLHETRPMALGPFYPASHSQQVSADLTRPIGGTGRALGEVLELTGRVLTVDNKPVVGARVEIWQANAAGRYVHGGDDNPAPLDPNFTGYSYQSTDDQGRYRFLTIQPGAYPAGNYIRSAHIHFDIDGKVDRLITQLYMPADDKTLAQDRTLQHDLWQQHGPVPREIFGNWTRGGSTLEKGAALCEFDIVLADG